jgi:glycerol-3-phosphate dehydrogenase
MEQEIEFILQTAALYLDKKPARSDILSVFAGIRPLVRSGEAGNTAALSRDHTIRIENSGMVTICGGKWTTYRHMAEDCVNQAATLARLPDRPCVTEHLNVHGFHPASEKFGGLWMFGSDAPLVEQLSESDPSLAAPLDSELPYTGAEVVWAVREEMARAVEDVLARRTRALFLNAPAALRMAPRVAQLMAVELKQGNEWEAEQLEAFRQTARNYVVTLGQGED